jgi:peroxiredoxin
MRAALAVALCVSLGLASTVRADPRKGEFARDIEAKEWLNTDGNPISIAECRGMVVVLFFWVSWNPGGEYIMPMMNFVNASPSGRSAGVFLIGVTDSDKARVDEMLKKEKVFFPIALEAKETFDEYKIEGGSPRVVVIDAAGKIAWSGWPGGEGESNLVTEIARVIAETPPTRTHPEEAEKARAYLKQARAALRDEHYREAAKAAQNAFEKALRGDQLNARCQDMLDLIEALGRDKLAQAEQAVDERDFESAVTLLVEIRRDFGGIEVARNVKKKLAALRKKHPEVAEILKQQEDIGQAELRLAMAMDEIRARDFGPAYERLEQIKEEYASTETANKAQTLLERMDANQKIMGYVRDHKASQACRTLLSQAEAYIRNGQTTRARELYREILDKYGDTIYAEEAARRLTQL